MHTSMQTAYSRYSSLEMSWYIADVRVIRGMHIVLYVLGVLRTTEVSLFAATFSETL